MIFIYLQLLEIHINVYIHNIISNMKKALSKQPDFLNSLL